MCKDFRPLLAPAGLFLLFQKRRLDAQRLAFLGYPLRRSASGLTGNLVALAGRGRTA